MILFNTEKNYKDLISQVHGYYQSKLNVIHFDSYFDDIDQIIHIENKKFASIPSGTIKITFKYMCNSIYVNFEIGNRFGILLEDIEMFTIILMEGKDIVNKMDIYARKFCFAKTLSENNL